MANRIVLLCLFICLSTNVLVCGKGGSRGGGSRGGGSRGGGGSSGGGWGKWGSSSSSSSSWSKPSSNWGSSSSSSWNKPSSSWGSSSSSSSWGSSKPSSSWSTGSSKPSYPSSSSGLSGSGSKPSYPSSATGLSGSGSKPSYPSSVSGLSGSGGSKPSYPSSATGLSGSGSKPSYPSSVSGLSGSGGSKPSYPSSSSGLSGSGSKPSYPSSSSGLSGYNKPVSTGTNYPSSNSGWSGPSYKPGSGSAHGYPSSSNGLSGSNNRPHNTYHPSNSYNTNNGYGHSNTHFYTPSYYSTPQYVYVQQYRSSDSRYSDLLTGLALYNLGRSHNNYHHHYYYDDYYHRRYDTSSNEYRPQYTDAATCTLKIKENGATQSLKIPCEIVSTFTEGSKEEKKVVNTTVCETVTTSERNTSTAPVSSNPTSIASNLLPNGTLVATNVTNANETTAELFLNKTLITAPVNISTPISNTNVPLNVMPILLPNGTLVENTTSASNLSTIEILSSTNPPDVIASTTQGPLNPITTSTNETTKNVTKCTTTVGVDPMSIKGAPVKTTNMACSVEIITQSAVLRNPVDCKVLMEYSKMPEPKKESGILPARSTLKEWLSKPPWWASIFVGV